MAAGITTSLNTNTAALRDTFARYADWNGREREMLFEDQTRKFATELYMQTAAIAPTKATIAAKVKSLGWRVIKTGTPEQWAGRAVAKMDRKRGRPSRKDRAAMDAALSGKPTLEQMQEYVIKKRSKARLYLASGWLGAVVDLGGQMKATSGKVDRSRGGADIHRSPGQVSVEFWNRTEGMVLMDEKKAIVSKAIAVRMADMWVYITRKMNEGYAQLRRAA